ncbi:hypothetical protein GCM10020367_08410 [Streptomyces sannanensis]|uniref:EamA domain-containing protein n=1 Tax=Streptomyces sannanensis TaxID=285536 RepID=A0ABP6S5I0_9ACTN
MTEFNLLNYGVVNRMFTALYCEGHLRDRRPTGPVNVAAVLASLHPVITALAARVVLKGRLRSVQAAGAGLALVGTALPAAAGG